jgi:hypothetical protein
LAQPVLAVRLVDTNKVTGAKGGGEYTFGAINSRYVAGEIVYTPVTSSSFWGVPFDGIFMRGQSVMSPNDFPGAFIDTGSTLISTSTATAALINGQIPGATLNATLEAWQVPCSSTDLTVTAPNLFFQINGVRFGVPAADLAYQSSAFGDGMCLSAVQGGSNFTVLGDTFISCHYIVFEYENGDLTSPRLGLANRTDILPIL